MVKLEIPPLQNTTTDVVIVANRLIKRVMNVLHDAASVQSSKKMGHCATCCRQNKNLSTTMSQIRVLDILGKKKHRRAPRINLHIHHNADDSGSLLPVKHSSMWLTPPCSPLLPVAHSSLWPTSPCGPLLPVDNSSL